MIFYRVYTTAGDWFDILKQRHSRMCQDFGFSFEKEMKSSISRKQTKTPIDKQQRQPQQHYGESDTTYEP